MNLAKWAVIGLVLYFVFHALVKAHSLGSANLGSSGDGIVGTGYAPLLPRRNDVWAWAPPYGIPRQ